MKKLIYFLIISSLFIPNIYAYEFQNPDNELKVASDKREIYELKEAYEEFAGIDDEDEEELEYQPVNNDQYWWPIGSSDTTTSGGKTFATGDPETVYISSLFGAKDIDLHSKGHSGLDIGGGRKGETNIIAAKDGIVVYPTLNDKIDCPDGSEYGPEGECGNTYGNYVIIQHSDGNYTLYGHMYANTITVKAGDTVNQGQLIGKMGKSGRSNGAHLHFEVRLGENTGTARVNPLDYVDVDNPRPITSTGNLMDFIKNMEGSGPTDGNYYIAYTSNNDSNITIGYGVTWENNIDRFAKYGITSMSAGQKVEMSIVDQIKADIVNEAIDSIKATVANEGISLNDNQLYALVSRKYNTGNISGFASAYKKYDGKYDINEYKSTNDGLWKEYMSRPITGVGCDDCCSMYLPGLGKRRVMEWILFTTGEYTKLDDITVDDYPIYNGINWNGCTG